VRDPIHPERKDRRRCSFAYRTNLELVTSWVSITRKDSRVGRFGEMVNRLFFFGLMIRRRTDAVFIGSKRMMLYVPENCVRTLLDSFQFLYDSADFRIYRACSRKFLSFTYCCVIFYLYYFYPRITIYYYNQ